jgi:hypothetical protein
MLPVCVAICAGCWGGEAPGKCPQLSFIHWLPQGAVAERAGGVTLLPLLLLVMMEGQFAVAAGRAGSCCQPVGVARAAAGTVMLLLLLLLLLLLQEQLVPLFWIRPAEL